MTHKERPFDRAAQKESYLGTIRYEIRMLRYALDWLLAHGADYEPAEERHVHLEAYLLHFRNLVNFLSGSGGSAGDLTIKSPQVWGEGTYSNDALVEIGRLGKQVYTAHSGNISTFLVHCTAQRHDRVQVWLPKAMYEEIEPALRLFEKTFPSNGVHRAEITMLSSEAHSTATIIRHPPILSTRKDS